MSKRLPKLPSFQEQKICKRFSIGTRVVCLQYQGPGYILLSSEFVQEMRLDIRRGDTGTVLREIYSYDGLYGYKISWDKHNGEESPIAVMAHELWPLATKKYRKPSIKSRIYNELDLEDIIIL